IIFITTTVIFFWFGTLSLFYEGLEFFHKFPLIGPVLMDEALYLFFAALFIMLTLSSIVICYVTYYTSMEVDFLFSKPINEVVIFFYRFFQSVIFSSWAFLFLGAPFMLAYGMVTEVPFWFYISTPFYFLPFIVLPTAMASIVILAIMRVMDYRKIKYLLIGMAIAGTIILFLYYKLNIRPSFTVKTEMEYFINNLLYHLRLSKHPLFPGYWMAKAIVNASSKAVADSLFYLSTFTINTLFFLLINWGMSKKFYSRGWLSSRGRGMKKEYPLNRGTINRVTKLFTFVPRPALAMITKDIKVFFRDFGQWSQFLIYFGILVIYIFNLRNMPLSFDNVYWKVIITFLNLSATALVLAGFTVRFLFPVISLEGNKIWLLGLAPISFRNVLFQKFTIYLLFILFVSEFLMISTNIMLKSNALLFYMSCGIAAMASFGLVGLSIGLGSLYPNFREDNTARIVSGFGGTLNFVIALLYVSFIIVSFALPYFSYEIKQIISEKTFVFSIVIATIITISVTALVSLLPIFVGYRKLENMEF
ncbi:MAG: hypothetical protein JXB42_01970, partial [Deltaproteobacteria bacterium]|nr:hypothetical protein [Deltaproteobacteria bacterium]